jgi:hypothetical protein
MVEESIQADNTHYVNLRWRPDWQSGIPDFGKVGRNPCRNTHHFDPRDPKAGRPPSRAGLPLPASLALPLQLQPSRLSARDCGRPAPTGEDMAGVGGVLGPTPASRRLSDRPIGIGKVQGFTLRTSRSFESVGRKSKARATCPGISSAVVLISSAPRRLPLSIAHRCTWLRQMLTNLLSQSTSEHLGRDLIIPVLRFSLTTWPTYCDLVIAGDTDVKPLTHSILLAFRRFADF